MTGKTLLALLALASALPCQGLYDLATVRTLDLTFAQPDWWQQLEAGFDLPTRPPIAADLTVDGVTYPNVGVRFRGASSYYGLGPTNIASPPPSAFKKPFKIEVDAFVPGQKVLGYQTINLNNNFLDPSWLREVGVYALLRRHMPAPLSNFVRLRINGQDWGPYANTEQINADFLDEHYRSDEGHRYKAKRDPAVDSLFSSLSWLGTDPAVYDHGFDLKSTNQPSPWLDLIGLCNVLNNTPPAQRLAMIPTVLDVDNALRYLAGTHALVTLDGYTSVLCHNFYVAFDAWHARATIVPWDQNLAFGTATGGGAVPDTALTDPYFRDNDPLRPLMHVLMQEPSWRARYRHHARTIGREYDWSVLGPELQALRARIDPLVQGDPRSIYTYQQFQDNFTQTVRVSYWNPYPTQATLDVPGIQPFVQARAAFLQAHADLNLAVVDLADLTATPARPTPVDALTFTVRVAGGAPVAAVTLFHRVRGPWLETPMRDDGQSGDGAAGDGVYGASLPAQPAGTRLEYYAGASASGTGTLAFEPERTEFRPPFLDVAFLRGRIDVVINEVLAQNTRGIQDEVGEFEDWIELKNVGAGAVDLSGKYMTDHLSNPTDWVIPPNTVLGPGQTLLIWADNDAPDGPYHADFRLSAAGDEVYLIDRDAATILDELRFGPQRSDTSIGRRRDGEARWVWFPEPTPRASNEIAGCGMRRFSYVEFARNPIDLQASGSFRIGQSVSFASSGGPSNALHALFVDVFTSTIPLGFSESILLLGPLPFTAGSTTSDAGGLAGVQLLVPNDAGLVGRSFWFQMFALGPIGDIRGSNAVEIRHCQ